jgi:hypothetical protein
MRSRVQRENSRQITDILVVKPMILGLRHGTVSQPNAPLIVRYNIGIVTDYPSLRAECMQSAPISLSVCLHFQLRILPTVHSDAIRGSFRTQLSALDFACDVSQPLTWFSCESLSSAIPRPCRLRP